MRQTCFGVVLDRAYVEAFESIVHDGQYPHLIMLAQRGLKDWDKIRFAIRLSNTT